MSMSEMMQQSANQKREHEKQSRDLQSQLEQMIEMKEMIAQIVENQATIAPPVDLEPIRQQLKEIIPLAEQVLQAANQKEARAEAMMTKADQNISALRGVLGEVRREIKKIEKAAQTIKAAPKSLTEASRSARNKLGKTINRLQIKGVLLVSLTGIGIVLLMIAIGVMFLKSQDLSVKVMTESDQFTMSLGEEIQQKYSHWTEEEREMWEKLRKTNTK